MNNLKSRIDNNSVYKYNLLCMMNIHLKKPQYRSHKWGRKADRFVKCFQNMSQKGKNNFLLYISTGQRSKLTLKRSQNIH